jgi:hypothetical protein
MRHCAFDNLACGLLNKRLYAKHPDARDLLEKVTRCAQRSLEREPRTITPSHNNEYYGLPQEWPDRLCVSRNQALRAGSGGADENYSERVLEAMRKAFAASVVGVPI